MGRVVSDVIVTVETTGHADDHIVSGIAGERGRIGRYSVSRLLGAGGMGQVYAARDPELDRMVAIKVLRPEISSLRANARLHREARAMAKLSHPNLIAVHDVGMDDGQLFVAMELITGQTLRAWVRGKRTHEIIDAYIAAGRGLAAAHGAGIVHRDFKPDNVLVGNDGRVAVSDFGLARTAQSDPDSVDGYANDVLVTQAGTLVGTVRYMAPEQLDRRDADERSDQFAFCVALWEALDADPFGPVDPSWDSETFAQRRREAIAGRRRLGSRLSGVPARVRRALVRGLSTDPAARWPSMEALLAELGTPRRRRYRILAAASATTVAGVATLIVMRPSTAKTDPCARAGDDFAGAWTLGDRERLIATFVASGAPQGASIANETVQILDRTGSKWRSMRVASCRADDRSLSACLDARRGQLRSLVDGLETAPNVEHAVSMTTHLAWSDPCGAEMATHDEHTAPAFDASTLWRPTGVYTPASSFALVDLDGHLQSIQRGADGRLHIATDVKTDTPLPGSPLVDDHAAAFGVDATTNTTVIAVRGRDGQLYVGTADPIRELTWHSLGTTDASPSLVVDDGVAVLAWLDRNHVRTTSRRVDAAEWEAPRDLGAASDVAPAIAVDRAHDIAVAFAAPDGSLAIRRGPVDGSLAPVDTAVRDVAGVHLAVWGGSFVVGVLGRDAHAYAVIEQVDGSWGPREPISEAAVIDPPTLAVYEGVTIALARDQDRALRYWVRNPNTRAYRYAPAQMWIGSRIVSGFGIGATPPAVTVAGDQLYVVTRGINDQQLYALNLGRFLAVDVLGGVYGISLGSLDVDPSASLFVHMRAFLALGAHSWPHKPDEQIAYPSANRPTVRELFGSWLRFDSARRHLATQYLGVFPSEHDFIAAAVEYRWGGERMPSPAQYAWLRDHYFDGIEYDRDGMPLR